MSPESIRISTYDVKASAAEHKHFSIKKEVASPRLLGATVIVITAEGIIGGQPGHRWASTDV